MYQPETNRRIARRALEEVWNQGNLDAIDLLYADDCVEHCTNSGMIPGSKDLKYLISPAVVGFPYERLTVKELYSAGDKVVARYVVHGCDTGSAGSWSALSRSARMQGALVMRFSGGKIKESWGTTRMLDLLRRCE
jgi:hypothetical protein